MDLEQHQAETASLPIPLSDRQRTVALWIAQGSTPTMIERNLGVALKEIGDLRCLPEFNLLIDELRKELVVIDPIPIEQQVAESTKEVFSVIKHHMYSGNEKISLSAAQTLFDRQLPKRTLNENAPGLQVKIDGEDLGKIFGAMMEAAGAKPRELVDMTEVEQLKFLEGRILKGDGEASS